MRLAFYGMSGGKAPAYTVDVPAPWLDAKMAEAVLTYNAGFGIMDVSNRIDCVISENARRAADGIFDSMIWPDLKREVRSACLDAFDDIQPFLGDGKYVGMCFLVGGCDDERFRFRFKAQAVFVGRRP